MCVYCVQVRACVDRPKTEERAASLRDSGTGVVSRQTWVLWPGQGPWKGVGHSYLLSHLSSRPSVLGSILVWFRRQGFTPGKSHAVSGWHTWATTPAGHFSFSSTILVYTKSPPGSGSNSHQSSCQAEFSQDILSLDSRNSRRDEDSSQLNANLTPESLYQGAGSRYVHYPLQTPFRSCVIGNRATLVPVTQH